MKKIIIAAMSFTLFGCVSDIKYNYVPETSQISFPELNTVTTTYIGDDMIRQGNIKLVDTISFSSKTDITRTIQSFIIDAGDYPKLGEDKTYLFFDSKSIDGKSIVKSYTNSLPVIGIRVRKDNNKNEVCLSFPTGTDFCNYDKQYQFKKVSITGENQFQQILIYTGKIENKINIGYREFSNNMARPAFANNAEYDLSSSKIIRYKGAVIEVLEATNQYIKYKMLSNFNTQTK